MGARRASLVEFRPIEGHNSRVVITVIDVTGHRRAEKVRERLRKAQVDLAHVAGASFYFTLPTRH
jgi:hypothetical protein